MNTDFQVKILDKTTIDQQIKVYSSAFDSKWEYEVLRNYWKNKHYKNPIHDSYMFGIYDGNVLVSMNAYMPMSYYFGDRIINVIQSCESGTLPEYRGKGLWSKVVIYAIDYFRKLGKYDFLIGFPNYENSYGGFMKMKWNHDSDIINYIMIVNGSNFVNTLFGKKIALGKIFEIQKMKLTKNILLMRMTIIRKLLMNKDLTLIFQKIFYSGNRSISL